MQYPDIGPEKKQMYRKLLKYIQDSDVAITVLLFAIAILSFSGVPDNIWDNYLYIDWVFPLASSYIIFIIASVFLIKSIRKIILKNIDNDLKINNALFITSTDNPNAFFSLRNIKNITVIDHKEINPFILMKHDNVVIDSNVLEQIKQATIL